MSAIPETDNVHIARMAVALALVEKAIPWLDASNFDQARKMLVEVYIETYNSILANETEQHS